MATSTPDPGYFGNSTGGFGGGSGMTQMDDNRWLVQSGNGEGEWESRGGEEERV